MNVLVWHWGRHGAGPVFASSLSNALSSITGGVASLALSSGAEMLTQADTVSCDWAEPTYRNIAGFIGQLIADPFLQRRTIEHLRAINPDFAVCAMPALLDRRMAKALRQSGIPYAVVVHEASAHLGEGLAFWMLAKSKLLRHAAALFPLTAHVEADLRRQGYGRNGQVVTKLWHPPLFFGDMKPSRSHGGKPRLLCFGRLQPYKGLNIFADALTALGPELPFEVRVCGDGPVSRDFARLRELPGVEVDRRWIPESELHDLFEWSDAVVLPYLEASQSGVAAVAIAHGRQIVATNVGGLPEQLTGVNGAIICEPNAAALTEALKTITNATAWPMPENTQASWQRMAAKMLQALEDINVKHAYHSAAPAQYAAR